MWIKISVSITETIAMDNICTLSIALELTVVKLVLYGVMINHRSYKQDLS